MISLNALFWFVVISVCASEDVNVRIIYDDKVKDFDGETVSMSIYKNKSMVIAFMDLNYKNAHSEIYDLNRVYEMSPDYDFKVIGFSAKKPDGAKFPVYKAESKNLPPCLTHLMEVTKMDLKKHMTLKFTKFIVNEHGYISYHSVTKIKIENIFKFMKNHDYDIEIIYNDQVYDFNENTVEMSIYKHKIMVIAFMDSKNEEKLNSDIQDLNKIHSEMNDSIFMVIGFSRLKLDKAKFPVYKINRNKLPHCVYHVMNSTDLELGQLIFQNLKFIMDEVGNISEDWYLKMTYVHINKYLIEACGDECSLYYKGGTTDIKTVYDSYVNNFDGNTVKMSIYKNKKLLIVVMDLNYENAQFEIQSLNDIHNKWCDNEFAVIGFSKVKPGSAQFPVYKNDGAELPDCVSIFKEEMNPKGGSGQFSKFMVNQYGTLYKGSDQLITPEIIEQFIKPAKKRRLFRSMSSLYRGSATTDIV